MNRLDATFILIACALPALASAGEIFGAITGDTGPVAEGTLVEASCKAGKHGPARTDKTGRYRLVIGETGRCTLSITRDGTTASLDVVSFDDSAQVDVVLKKDASGKLTARRK